jgi:hypothetical protein
MMVGLRENEFMGCGEYTRMVIWEIEGYNIYSSLRGIIVKSMLMWNFVLPK